MRGKWLIAAALISICDVALAGARHPQGQTRVTLEDKLELLHALSRLPANENAAKPVQAYRRAKPTRGIAAVESEPTRRREK